MNVVMKAYSKNQQCSISYVGALNTSCSWVKSFWLDLGGSGPYTTPIQCPKTHIEKKNKGGKTCRHAAVAPFHHLAITTTHIICKSG